MNRRWIAAALALGLLVGLPACSDDGPGPGEGNLVVDGAAVVRTDDGEERVTGERELRPGDEVEMLEGTATVELAGDVVLELREAVDDGRASALRMDDVPTLLRGDLLVVAGGSEPAEIEAAGTTLAVSSGAARVSRALNVRAGVYEGALAITSASREVEVDELHQVAVPALGLVAAPRPLQLDARDPWDRRILGDVIQLSGELDRRAQGFTSQVGAGASEPEFFLTRFEAPAVDEDDVRSVFRPGRTAGEHLIGIAIASLGDDGDAGERLDRVFRFRAAGAAWGVVARREGVEREPLLARVDDVIAGDDIELALSAPVGDGVTPTTLPDDGDTGGSPGDPGPSPTTRPTSPPPTQGPGPTTPRTNPPTPTVPPPTVPPVPILPTLPPTPLDPVLPPPPEDDGQADQGVVPSTGTPLDPVLAPVDEILGGLLP